MGQQREEVLAKLRQLITHGHYVPGRLFSENDLIRELGVSRSPIREALAVLAQEGLVEQHHRKGISVRLMGEPETREVLQLRRSIEQMVVQRLATSDAPDRLDGVEEVLKEMDHAAETRDTARFLDADTDFHCGLARRAGYSAAADMLRTLRDKVRIVGLDSLQRYTDFPKANKAHRALIQAIRINDADGAVAILNDHLDSTHRLLLREIETREQEPELGVEDIRKLVSQARDLRRHEGRVRESIELLEEAAERARLSPRLDHYLVQVLLELSTTRRSLRDFRAAEKYAQEALDISYRARNRAGQAWANSELGRIAVEAQRGDLARLDTASDLFMGLSGSEDDGQRGWNRYGLGLRALAHDNSLEAQFQATSALEVFTRVGDAYGRGKALELLGRLAGQQDKQDEARGLLSQARELAEKENFLPLLASIELEEGRLLRASGAAPEEADAKFRQAFELFRSMKDGQGMSDALEGIRGNHLV